jgi:AcrR family transcriptional regulator
MTSQRTGRRAQAERRRDQLLEVGLRLFADQGFESTTIADIARETGAAHGLVYHYFASKEELLNEILKRFSFLAALRDLMAVAPGRPAREVLPEIATGFSAMLDERSDLLRLVVRESQTNPQVAAALGGVIGEGLMLLTDYLDGRIAAGELRQHDVTVTARAIFWALVAGHLSGNPPRDFPAGLADVILRGVLARNDADQQPDGADT